MGSCFQQDGLFTITCLRKTWLRTPPKMFVLFPQASKWRQCTKLISGEEPLNSTTGTLNDADVFVKYNLITCSDVLNFHFAHARPSTKEQHLPIAFGLSVYKSARLLERILQAIYMPHNLYCIHIDRTSDAFFHRAVESMVRCLPNVFLAKHEFHVVWGHISLIHAQLSCMRELLESSVEWKYFISLTGQNFPLYENGEIVTALRSLNGSNSIESFPIPDLNKGRTRTVHRLGEDGASVYDTGRPKSPPPHNISIFKGSTHIVAVREFVDFVVNSRIGKDFVEFLADTYVPDETLYASLQQHPLAPGGVRGKQPEWIPRALRWANWGLRCHGHWVRTVCWISILDLRWVLGREMSTKLFVLKIPFDYSDELLDCISVAGLRRKYPTTIWHEGKEGERNEI